MHIKELNNEHLSMLKSFISMSNSVGSKPDYIQAGGGNTSIKLGDIMAVKCSGCQLKDMKLDFGYVCLPYKEISNIFESSPRDANSESTTSAKINELVIEFEGLPSKRPSVEAGFHALLGNVVIHSHAIYANIFNCIKDGEQKLAEILKPAGVDYLFFDFINPSADLAFAILDMKKKLNRKLPNIIFLKNHGLIIWADTVDQAIEYNDLVLGVLKNALKLNDYPVVELIDNGEYCTSDNKFIMDMISDGSLTKERILKTPLYPDQLVYLNNNLIDGSKLELDDNTVKYKTTYNSAYSLEETLLAYAYLLKVADKNGYELELMPQSGIQFILGWDAEKYRSQMLK